MNEKEHLLRRQVPHRDHHILCWLETRLVQSLICFVDSNRNKTLLGWWKESADRQDQVESAQEESFEPGGFAVQADERVESSHQAKHRHFQQREVEVKRHADEWTREYQDGRGQQGDLDRRASGNGHRDLHVIVGGRGDGGVVLSSVAHNRQNDETDKKRTQSDLAGQWLDSAHQYL